MTGNRITFLFVELRLVGRDLNCGEKLQNSIRIVGVLTTVLTMRSRFLPPQAQKGDPLGFSNTA